MSTAELIAAFDAHVSAGGAIDANMISGIVSSVFPDNAAYRVDGATSTLLYSGTVGDTVSANDIAINIAKQSEGRIAIIDNTAVGQALGGNLEFETHLAETIRIREGLSGDAAMDKAKNILFGDRTDTNSRGVWDSVSDRFVSQAEGPVKTITPDASSDGVFARTEISAAIDNLNIQSIDGIDASSLRAQVNADIAKGVSQGLAPEIARAQAIDNARLAVSNASYATFYEGNVVVGQTVSYDGEGRIVSKDLTVNVNEHFFSDANIRDVPAFSNDIVDPKSGSKLLGIIDDARLASLADAAKYLEPLGKAFDVLEAGLGLYNAKQKYDAGDLNGAGRVLAETGGSLVGGALGATGAIALAGALALTGPVGWVAAVGIGLAGGYVGGEIGTEIGGRLYDWLGDNLSAFGESVGDIAGFLADLGEGASRVIDGVSDAASRMAERIGEFGESAVRNAIDAVVDLLDNASEFLPDILEDALGLAEDLAEALGPLKDSLLDGLRDMVGDLLDKFDLGNLFLGTPDDQSGFTGIWCCVTVDKAGRWVAYESSDPFITSDDANGKSDIFVYQLKEFVYEIGSIQRVSIGYDGQEGNGDSFNPVLSPEGDWIAYTSFATNLVVGDTNDALDVFLSGIDLGPERISVTSVGAQANGDSYFATVSHNADGVAFVSDATNLVANDTNNASDIFLRDRLAGETVLISKSVTGGAANGDSTMPAISADGQRVAFVSAASNLIASDTNERRDIFIHDRSSGATELLTRGLGGAQANGDSWAPVMSSDGRFVAFFSDASNLVANDTNAASDVFLLDLYTGVIDRVSVADSGVQANGASGGEAVSGPEPGNAWGLAVSDDGRFVSFISQASNLVENDTNNQSDVFLRDRLAQTTIRINMANGVEASGGPQGSHYAGAVAMSGDASVIGYISDATNLHPGDANPLADVFILAQSDPISADIGNATPEVITGAVGNQLLAGLGGDDTLSGADGDDRLFGGGGEDALDGGEGDDSLDGGPGADTLIGGYGDDIYFVNDDLDQIIEEAYQGDDEVRSTISISIRPNIEKLTLLGSNDIDATGSGGDDRIQGNAGANHIEGGAGYDILSGGAGDDTVFGGGGNDRIQGEAGADTLDGGGGGDTLNGGADDDRLVGGTGHDALFGDEGRDVLLGGLDDDTLDGGPGPDSMDGGPGNDQYVVDDIGDIAAEVAPSNGYDRVESFVTHTLGMYIEDLKLVGDAPIDGYGNESDNWIEGNSKANTLDGKGGSNYLQGGDGDDTYIVNSGNDSVYETEDGGFDTIRSGISIIIPYAVEKLILTGTASIDGIGNEFDNIIVGNVEDNSISGGVGADTMQGGAGNDTYEVDQVGDVVVETPGGGVDTVLSMISYTLGANLENLTLSGYLPADGTGNAGANHIVGNDYRNTLAGLAGDDLIEAGGDVDVLNGGAGDDTLDGGEGADLYVFDGSFGQDIVNEASGYTGQDDVIRLADINAVDDLSILRSGDRLTITVRGTSDAVALPNQYQWGDGTSAQIAHLELADGSRLRLNEGLRSVAGNGDDAFQGTAGADTLIGLAGDDIILGNADPLYAYSDGDDDTLDGGAGNDTLDGGVGADLYLFAGAFGHDVILESDGYVGEGDVIRLQDVSQLDAVSIVRSAGDLKISTADGANSIVVRAQFEYGEAESARVSEIELADGTRVPIDFGLHSRGTDASESITGTAGADTLIGLAGDDNILGNADPLYAYSDGDDDTLDGGAGNDTLDGGVGADLYLFAGAFGRDVILESDGHFGEGDVIVLADASGVDEVSIIRTGETLTLSLLGADDAIIVPGQFTNGEEYGARIDFAEFADGSRVRLDYGLISNGTEDGEFAEGTDGADVLNGRGGADTLIGRSGADTLDGGTNPEGAGGQGDVMLGGEGDDLYIVDSGLDLVDEGTYFVDFWGGGIDTIVSKTDFYWDIASVGERLQVAPDVHDEGDNGVTVVASMYDTTIEGHAGIDIAFGRGGADVYRLGDGVDWISLSTLGLDETNAYYGVDGVNTVIVEQRTSGAFSYDIVFEFEPGKDKLDVSDYGFASEAAAYAMGIDDGLGNCYFTLGDGLDYLYIVGHSKAEISESDFVI